MRIRPALTTLFYIVFGILLWPTVSPALAYAQETFSTTGSGGNGGGALAAKANALAIFASDRTAKIEFCGNSGKIYAPSHARADANGCIQDFEINAEGKSIFARIAEFFGGVKLGFPTTCSSNTEGTLRYDTATKQVTVCNGTDWTALVAAGGGLVDGMIDHGDCKVIYAFNETPTQCGNDYAITATFCAGAGNCSLKHGSGTYQAITGWYTGTIEHRSTATAICCRYRNHGN